MKLVINMGRRRGGLPNETGQNIRKSGYGYVEVTRPLPRDMYRRYDGNDTHNINQNPNNQNNDNNQSDQSNIVSPTAYPSIVQANYKD